MRILSVLFVFFVFVCHCAFGSQGDDDPLRGKAVEYKLFKSSSAVQQSDSVSHLLEQRQWIVEVDKIPGRRGSSIQMDNGAFFVVANGSEAVLCIDDKSRITDSSSVVRGTIERYDVSIANDQPFYLVDMVVKDQEQVFNITVEINASTSVSWVKVSGKRMRKSVFIGRILSQSESSVFQTLEVQ